MLTNKPTGYIDYRPISQQSIIVQTANVLDSILAILNNLLSAQTQRSFRRFTSLRDCNLLATAVCTLKYLAQLIYYFWNMFFFPENRL